MGRRPEIIERYWYAIDWDVPSLWALDLPVVHLSMDDLIWHLDVPVWPDEAGQGYQVTPRQVYENKMENPTEFARIMAADLSFPIEVLALERRLMILDGIHRLTKAHLEGRAEVSARMVPPSAVQKLK